LFCIYNPTRSPFAMPCSLSVSANAFAHSLSSVTLTAPSKYCKIVAVACFSHTAAKASTIVAYGTLSSLLNPWVYCANHGFSSYKQADMHPSLLLLLLSLAQPRCCGSWFCLQQLLRSYCSQCCYF